MGALLLPGRAIRPLLCMGHDLTASRCVLEQGLPVLLLLLRPCPSRVVVVLRARPAMEECDRQASRPSKHHPSLGPLRKADMSFPARSHLDDDDCCCWWVE